MNKPFFFVIALFCAFNAGFTASVKAESTAEAPITASIPEKRCVQVTLKDVHSSITDYPNYVNVPDSTYMYDLMLSEKLVISLPMLRMVTSEARYDVRGENEVRAKVWVEFQPSKLTRANAVDHFPRFLLNCASKVDSSGQKFTHECKLEPRALHYGLQDFSATLTATANAPECEGKGTHLDYLVTLTGNPQEIKKIRAAVAKDLGPLMGPLAVARAFKEGEESDFFKKFYKHYYEAWVKHLLSPRLRGNQ